MATIALIVVFGCGPQSVESDTSETVRDLSDGTGSTETAGEIAGVTDGERPNIVFILADDLGWSDTTLYGTTTFYETPNIERLANRGMRFTNAYAAHPLCSPTRASILTGLEPGRLGLVTAFGPENPEVLEAELPEIGPFFHRALMTKSVSRLDTKYQTLAETLQNVGFATGHFGKWHLGPEPYSPLEHGFDVDVPHGYYAVMKSYLAPWNFTRPLDFKPATPNEHIEDRMANEAVAFIEENKDRPFFLNYWAISVHTPFSGKEELVAKYAAKADPDDPQRTAVYGAMVESLDDAVGTLLDTLDRLELSENTIIVFFSDNGAYVHKMVDGIPPTSNAPLRGGKGNIYEGGTRVPCAVIWPGKTKPASQSDAFLTSTDWYPTLMDMLDVDTDLAFDGISQVPAILGKTGTRESIACFSPRYLPKTGTFPATYLRRGDWKLIRFHYDSKDQIDRFELYNLRDDIGETTNVADQHPERVRAMNEEISDYLAGIGALVPQPNPDFTGLRPRPVVIRRINGHRVEYERSIGIQGIVPIIHSPKCDLIQCTSEPVSDDDLSDLLGEIGEFLD
jgi:arylsulfatase A-like enzyme